MAVRTAVLAIGIGQDSVVVPIYTCPAGKTAILKDVRISVPSGTASRAVVILKSGPRDIAVLDTPNLGTGITSLQGFMVLEPGDQIALFSNGAAILAWCSGAELFGVAP